MSCTTLLAGKKATYDGSTFIARNDDSSSGKFTVKKFTVVNPEDQPRDYTAVISHLKITLPDNPQRYTAVPNAVKGEGIWAASGANESNVAMTATETITSNERVLGADPLVEYAKKTRTTPEKIGGIGEEDLVVITLPYIRSAREGVVRLGKLLEQYGTYEMNGIAFSDVNEVWWFETVGGHHWIARRVPDDAYAVIPNQLGLDSFDMHDALGARKDHMCSADLAEFISAHHLNLSLTAAADGGTINPRDLFGSHDDSDHVYNTPRAWFMERYLNPHALEWDGPAADCRPEADDIPWCRVPEKKITVEDAKYVLSSHFQGTPYDPYAASGDQTQKNKYRSIGVNRTSVLALFQIRTGITAENSVVEWVTFGSNVFNAFVPFYTAVRALPQYLSGTTGTVTTENFYWANRIIGALADAYYLKNLIHIERYQQAVQSQGHALIQNYDEKIAAAKTAEERMKLCAQADEAISVMLKKETDDVLGHVLYESSCLMKNAFARSDA